MFEPRRQIRSAPILGLVAVCACSSPQNGPEAGSGGNNPITAGGTSSGSGSGSGTAGVAVAGGGMSAGAGGTVATGGVAGSGGGGGLTMSGSPAAGGSAGGAEDPFAAAEVLDGFALLKPCVNWTPSGVQNNGDCCCEELAENENQHIVKQFGGDPQITYQVKLRIAGVAERYWYAGGQLDQASKLFYTGGLPTIHSAAAPNTGLSPGQGACKIHPPETDAQFALPFSVPAELKPEDGCYNGFNIFAVTVSSPKQTYYLNYTADYDGDDRQPHSVYKTDYTVTVPIAGRAQLDFYTIDGDHHQVTNNGTMTVPDVNTPQPYNGNFLELAVLEVSRAPL